MPTKRTTKKSNRRPARAGKSTPPKADYALKRPDTRVYVGDCRELLPQIPEVAAAEVDLIFADPPFNWARDYDRHLAGDAWDDKLPDDEYLGFTRAWLDACHAGLRPNGSMWVNIPDTWAAEIVVHLKHELRMTMVNWCVWHYRFGQNTMHRFINSKVHALYFSKHPTERTWNADPILEESDRATTYADPRTMAKKSGRNGMRVPMDVWYGRYWGRIQGNNKERRANHDNQIPEVYLERVVRACSNEGDLVLDPFLGSGTTGVVARALERRFIGTEFAPSNAESAFSRIKAGPVRVDPRRPTVHRSTIFEPRMSPAREDGPPERAEGYENTSD